MTDKHEGEHRRIYTPRELLVRLQEGGLSEPFLGAVRQNLSSKIDVGTLFKVIGHQSIINDHLAIAIARVAGDDRAETLAALQKLADAMGEHTDAMADLVGSLLMPLASDDVDGGGARGE